MARLAGACAAIALTAFISMAAAQTAPPPGPAPAPTTPAPAPAATPAPAAAPAPAPAPALALAPLKLTTVALPVGAQADAGCNAVEKPISAGGASIVPETTGQLKNWQPPGGEIAIKIRSFTAIPPDALVLVCFRWLRTDDVKVDYVSSRPRHLEFTDGGRLLSVTVAVPSDLGPAPGRFSGKGQYAGFWLVPLTEVRILALAKDASGSYIVAADVTHSIGVTSPLWALALALATVVVAFTALSAVCRWRLARTGTAARGMLLQIVTSPDGYASLSQAQIVLWTFVVAASAVYVMALSGELIEVTTGTLVLLGISGSVSVLTRWHDTSQGLNLPPPGTSPRQARWSDLVTHEVEGRPEIDVTRVQMLYFTLITATFVVMRVLTTYVIPEIPEGFQILMGISNAVYVGSKVASTPPAGTKTDAPAPAPPPAPPPPASTG